MKFLTYLLFICLIFSCKKSLDNYKRAEKITLPPYSETGSFTFGFRYNGLIWTVFGRHYDNSGLFTTWNKNGFVTSASPSANGAIMIYTDGRMTIIKDEKAITDLIAGFSFVPTSPFVMNYYLTENFPGNFVVIDAVANKRYESHNRNPFVMQVTKFEKIDSVFRILSGRFSGVLYNKENIADSLIITEGRFDTEVAYK